MLSPGLLTPRGAADPGIPGKGTEGEPGAGSEEAGERAEAGAGTNPRTPGSRGRLVRKGNGVIRAELGWKLGSGLRDGRRPGESEGPGFPLTQCSFQVGAARPSCPLRGALPGPVPDAVAPTLGPGTGGCTATVQMRKRLKREPRMTP